jgi:hypothetical protein
MSQRVANVFGDSFGQGQDRQKGIYFECGPDEQRSKNYELRSRNQVNFGSRLIRRSYQAKTHVSDTCLAVAA